MTGTRRSRPPRNREHHRRWPRADRHRCRVQGPQRTKHQRFKVYVAGQKRGLTAAIKRAFRRRSAVEPTIGHLKNEHRMGRNHLAGRAGDATNAVLAAAGYNFRLLLRWLALLLHFVLAALTRPSHPSPTFAQP